MANEKQGKVYLVGAGPGDPELLTRKADRLIREARLLLHDDLVAAEIVALAGANAEVVNVGKRCGQKRITQAEINERMIEAARRGVEVVRLKSGDPAIFGRLGEELEALRTANVAFEIVPGITAGIAAAAVLGLSLTDRRTASRLLIASAHHAAEHSGNEGSSQEKEDWSGLVNGGTTLMIYMPGHGLAGLREELLSAGLRAETPVIIVSKATTHQQQHTEATLRELGAGEPLPAPSVLLIGEAVRRASCEGKPEEISALLRDADAMLATDA